MEQRRRRAKPPPTVELPLIDEVRAFHKSITKNQSNTENKGLFFSVPKSDLIQYCKETLCYEELASSLGSAAYLFKLDKKWSSCACLFCGQWLIDDSYEFHIKMEHVSQLSPCEKAMKPKLINEDWEEKLKTWDWRPIDPDTKELSEDPERRKLLKKIGQLFKVFMHLQQDRRLGNHFVIYREGEEVETLDDCREPRFLSRCQLLHLIELALDYQYWMPDEPVHPEMVTSPDVFCVLDATSLSLILRHMEFLYELFKIEKKILDQGDNNLHRLSKYCKDVPELVESTKPAEKTDKENEHDEYRKKSILQEAVTMDSEAKIFFLNSTEIYSDTDDRFELLLSYLFGDKPEELYQLFHPQVPGKTMKVFYSIEEQVKLLARRLRRKCQILKNLKSIYALQGKLSDVRALKMPKAQEPMLREKLDCLVSLRKENMVQSEGLGFEFEFISSVLAFARILEASAINFERSGTTKRVFSLKNTSVEKAFRKVKHDVLTELDVLDLEIMYNLKIIKELEVDLFFLSFTDFRKIILPIMRSFLQKNWKKYMIANPPQDYELEELHQYEASREKNKRLFQSFEISDLSSESGSLHIDETSICSGTFQYMKTQFFRFAYYKLTLNFQGKYLLEGTKRIKGKLVISGESCWDLASQTECDCSTVVKGKIDEDEDNNTVESLEIDFGCLEKLIRSRLREFEKDYMKNFDPNTQGSAGTFSFPRH